MKSTGDKEHISIPTNTPGLFADAANAHGNSSEKEKKAEKSKRNARCRVSKGTQKRIAVLICSLILVLGVVIGVFFAVTMRKRDPINAALNTACELVRENDLYPILDAFLTEGGELSLSANGYREDKSSIQISSRLPIFPEFSLDASYAEDGEGAGQIRLETSMIYDEGVDAEIFKNKTCSAAAVFDNDKVYFATSDANDGKYFGFTTENFRTKLANSEYSHAAGNDFSFSETLEERVCSLR